MTEQKKDWVPVAAVGLGAVGLGAGLYLYLKKGRGVDPGDVLGATFDFDYLGAGGTFILQVSLGHIRIAQWFDHVEGMTWERGIELPGPGHYTEDMDLPLSAAASPDTYDAEALIRTPLMDWQDYLIKVLTKGAITIRKG